MKTSELQFQVLVEYMEKHGDLNKPVDGPHGRQQAAERWTSLIRLLNMDTSGHPKTLEKWKKVWSDYKNNTKRKAAKINRAAQGTGGGPACKLVLSDLEQRVLSLIGPVAATGMPGVAEVGVELPPQQPSGSPMPSPTQLYDCAADSPSLLNVITLESQEAALMVESLAPSPTSPHRTTISTPFRTQVVESAGSSPTAHARRRRAARHRRPAPGRGAARRRATAGGQLLPIPTPPPRTSANATSGGAES